MSGATGLARIREEVIQQLLDLFELADDGKRLALARLIQVRVREPQAFVTVVGETSTGKSTLINSLLGRPLLPVNAAPSTATVTQVICRKETSTCFLAIHRDATQEDITPAQFNTLSLNPPDDLLRLQLRVRPADDRYVGLQIFDTPGYNSLLEKHEEVLRAFLPESDVVVFVAGYRTGFGQVDQDLLEVVGSCVADDCSIPVVIAINRVPPGCNPDDRRVAEIVANVRDCLKREPMQVLVEAAPLTAAGENRPAMPNADLLWTTVANLVARPECKAAVDNKLNTIVQMLVRDCLADCERQEYELVASEEERAQGRAQIALLRDARNRSRKAVRQTRHRLERTMPDIVRRGCDQLKGKVEVTVFQSDKWLGSDDCAQWISIHELPFGVRTIGSAAEYEFRTELERLDQDLNEIANTAVQKVQNDVHVKSDATERFTENLVRTVLERVGGAAIQSLLRGVGGVGGAAAGAGNLVKMVVSRAGNIVGKTFSREVYESIGRTFTKKALGRLTVAAQVIIEVGCYLAHVKRWQGKLKKQACDSLDTWRDDTIHEVLNRQLPEIEQRNLQGVAEIYDDLVYAEKGTTQALGEEITRRRYAIRSRADTLSSMLQKLSSIKRYN